MKNEHNDNKKTGQSYLKFSGLVTQMILVILLFSYFGYWADKKMDLEKNQLTALFSILGVLFSFYLLFKQLPKQ